MGKFLTPILVASALIFGSLSASANDRAVVEGFYNVLLSNPNAPDMPDRAAEILIEKWESIPTPRGGKDREGFVTTLKGFGRIIPDLKWEIQEILQQGDRYIVRSIATGTPTGKMFGEEPTGKSFKIMTIDIHTVKDGKIVRSYHVEEWLKAKYQLFGKPGKKSG